MSYAGTGRGIGSFVPQLGGQFSAAVPIEEAAQITQQQEMQPIESELARYKLQGAQMETELAHSTYENSMIANAARTAMDDPEKWDANFQALADKGIAGASQFVGKYSPEIAERVTSAYDPQSPMARAARPPNAQSGGPEQYDELFKNATPEQIAGFQDKTGRILDLLSSAKDPQSWEAAKAAAVKAGIPMAQQLGPYNPLVVKRLYDHYLDLHEYLTDRVAGNAAGLPAPNIPGKTEKVGDTLYGINENTPTGTPTVTPLAHEPKSTLIGYDASGHPVYHDTTGGNPGEGPADTEGPYRVVQPAKGSAGASTFNAKVQAGMAAGMSYPDAIQFANGRKAMSPEQVRGAAAKMAEADMHADTMAGGQIGDPNAYIQQHTAMWENELTQHSEQSAQNTQTPAQPGNRGGPVPQGQFRAPNGQLYDQKATMDSARAAMQRARARKDIRAQNAVVARLKQLGLSAQGL